MISFKIIIVIVIIIVLISIPTVNANLYWRQWYNLPIPITRSCGVILKGDALILGGISSNSSLNNNNNNNNNNSRRIIAIDYSNPTEWLPLDEILPVALNGREFCISISEIVLITQQALQQGLLNPLSINKYLSVFEGHYSHERDKYGTIIQRKLIWKDLGAGPFPRIRCGIGAAENSIFENSPNYIILGGINIINNNNNNNNNDNNSNNYFVNKIMTYDRLISDWKHVTNVPSEVGTLCDCSSTSYKEIIYFLCRSCFDNNENNNNNILKSTITYKLVSINTKDYSFKGSIIILKNLTENVVLKRISHYLIIVSQNKNGNDPTLLFYDLFLNQLNTVNTTHFGLSRKNGSIFVIQGGIIYAGGENINNILTSNVNIVQIIEPFYVEVDHISREYNVGDFMTIETHICLPGMLFRLSFTESCTQSIPDISDKPCILEDDKGITKFLLTIEVERAYICISFGYCSTKNTERIPCYNGKNITFEECLYAHCCYDTELGECFAYNPINHILKKNNLIEDYFMLANSKPIKINNKIIDKNTSNRLLFFIILGVSLVILIIILLGVLCIFIRRKLRQKKENLKKEREKEYSFELPDGKYSVIKLIGKGGFGKVYLVERECDKQKLALKYMECKDEEARGFALKEFELLFQAQGHSHIVHLEEMFMNWPSKAPAVINIQTPNLTIVGDNQLKSNNNNNNINPSSPLLIHDVLPSPSPRYLCIVMEYFPEGDLLHYILHYYEKGLKVPEDMITKVFAFQICSALQHLHSRNPPIVHRDIKPENILLRSKSKEMVLADLGLAQQMEAAYMATRTGSLQYVAPECWQRRYTSTVDMWAVGCIMYGMATGRVQAKNARIMFMDAKKIDFYEEIRQDLALYSPRLREIVIGLLQVDPRKRLGSSDVLSLISE